MHGMTKSEVAEFKKIQEVSRNMRKHSDVMRVKRMAYDWVKRARTAASKQRRLAMTRCIKGAHTH